MDRLLKDATVQELNLELMKRGSFNSFDGEKIVKSLQDHPDLWIGAMMVQESVGEQDLISLRDMNNPKYGYDAWNIGTLFISAKQGKEKELEQLAKSDEWSADEIDYIKPDKLGSMLGTGRPTFQVLRVWWD
jgi:hypothetical protein